MKNINHKKYNKKLIGITAIVLVCLMVFIGINIFTNEDSSDNLVYNKNKSFLNDHKVIGIVFKDIKCTYDGNNSLITYKIVNTNNKKIDLYNYEILVKDKNKKVLTTIEFSYNNTIFPDEEIEISNSVVGVDLTDARYMNLKLNTKNPKKK